MPSYSRTNTVISARFEPTRELHVPCVNFLERFYFNLNFHTYPAHKQVICTIQLGKNYFWKNKLTTIDAKYPTKIT